MLFLGEHKYIMEYNTKHVKNFQMTGKSLLFEITLEYETIVNNKGTFSKKDCKLFIRKDRTGFGSGQNIFFKWKKYSDKERRKKKNE